MKKFSLKVIFLIILVVGIGAGYYLYADIEGLYQQAFTQLETGVGQLKTIEQKVITSAPLRGPTEKIESELTALGTVRETNAERTERGLPALFINTQLTKAAEIKVEDMFNRQYFEHESPTGEGPGDLADAARYEYILVGENLALGNHKDDEALVGAWMNSPGHRENILNAGYTEIGIAVGRGVFEGRTVWLAVQEFGRPLSLCLSPDETLKAKIDENQILLAELNEELKTKRDEIDNTRPKRGPGHNQPVGQYNELVDQYNALLDETGVFISEYNSQVNDFNVCAQG